MTTPDPTAPGAPSSGLSGRTTSGHDTSGLFVEESGEGPLVVLVHGSMDRHRSLLRIRARLSDCRVVVYDRRGYERSRGVEPAATGVSEHLEDLLTVLDAREAVVFGHSYGGVVTLAAAARRPDLVRGAVVYEPPLPWLDWWASPAPGPGGDQRSPFLGEDPGDAAERFVRRMIGDRRYERLPSSTRREIRADGPALVTELTAIRHDPPPFDPADVRIPVVVSRGGMAADRHVLGGEWLAANIADARLEVVEEASHGAHLSHPDELAAMIRSVLARTTP